jgi:hypothetical protein
MLLQWIGIPDTHSDFRFRVASPPRTGARPAEKTPLQGLRHGVLRVDRVPDTTRRSPPCAAFFEHCWSQGSQAALRRQCDTEMKAAVKLTPFGNSVYPENRPESGCVGEPCERRDSPRSRTPSDAPSPAWGDEVGPRACCDRPREMRFPAPSSGLATQPDFGRNSISEFPNGITQ